MPPPPPSSDERELKQRVTQTLASRGVLGKIKAQLRAAVFHVMHEHEPDEEEFANGALRPQEFGRDGELALELVLEFLAFFRLEHSLAVLTAETSADKKERGLVDASARLDALGLDPPAGEGGQQPLLIQLLRQKQSTGGGKGAAHSRDAHDTRLKTHQFDPGEDCDDGGETQEERAVELPRSAKLSSERPALSVASRFDEGDEEESDLRRDANTFDAKEGEASRADEEEEEEEEGEEAVDSESIASGSELDESIAEDQSASLNYSQDYESASKDDASDLDDQPAGTSGAHAAEEQDVRARTSAVRQEQYGGSEADDDDEARATDRPKLERPESEVVAVAPPPVPTTLSSLPPLASPSGKQSQQDDDEFDEELEAERLSSLDAKLKAMEAEDETGTLQQLKATLQMELQRADESVRSKRDGGAVAVAVAGEAGAADDEEPDGYGSDFEEEEVISEVSDEEEIESVADLSENDESASHSTLQLTAQQDEEACDAPPATLHDRAVDDENALNSYDYIEDVEKD